MAIEHRTKVNRGLDFNTDPLAPRVVPSFVAFCSKSCGWVGHRHFSETAAEREGEDHESYMARIES